MAGTKLADLSLQITPCKEDEKKILDDKLCDRKHGARLV
jgi:hypothetical protein